jgi:hypothetical protein
MQLGEQIAVDVMNEQGTQCPFDHTDPKKPPEVTNQLVGDGQTLGKHMEPAQTTVTYAPNKRDKPGDIPYPAAVLAKPKPIKIDGFDYPVTCAAHHLIPAQESLKRASALLDCMEAKLYPTKIGYDVNGVENGIWLPGNYAVGGNGTGEWTSAPSVLPDNEGGPPPKLPPAPAAAAGSSALTGYRHDLDKGRKGKYVILATQLARGQFHDRHVDYSKLVLSTLEHLALLYKQKHLESQTKCEECKKIHKKNGQLGTPYKLVHTMNGVSKKYSGYLKNVRGHKLVYTSRWGLAAEKRGMSALSP